MTPAIEIDSLRKTYPRSWTSPPFEAVKGISLRIDEGEVFGFVGPNGAGKSTTIRILTGASRPSAGTARLFGHDASTPEARRGLGYVPENPSLPDYLTPLEILRMGLALHGRQPADTRAHCLRWLERFGLGEVANKVVRGFSKGMAQRAALAHAMCIEPRLLILDEPLSGLDPVGRRDVVDILFEYKKQGGTLFFTSHVLHDVERLAGRFGLIHRGELRAVQSPAELAGEADLVLVRSIGEQAVDGLIPDFDRRWSAEVPRAALWELLERMRAADHVILEVRPALSLEGAFMRAIGKTPR